MPLCLEVDQSQLQENPNSTLWSSCVHLLGRDAQCCLFQYLTQGHPCCLQKLGKVTPGAIISIFITNANRADPLDQWVFWCCHQFLEIKNSNFCFYIWFQMAVNVACTCHVLHFFPSRMPMNISQYVSLKKNTVAHARPCSDLCGMHTTYFTKRSKGCNKSGPGSLHFFNCKRGKNLINRCSLNTNNLAGLFCGHHVKRSSKHGSYTALFPLCKVIQ